MRKILFIITIIFVFSNYVLADEYLNVVPSAYTYEPIYDDRYVNESGDTMTGFLNLHAAPTSSLHAATKGYVDTTVGDSGWELDADDNLMPVVGSFTAVFWETDANDDLIPRS